MLGTSQKRDTSTICEPRCSELAFQLVTGNRRTRNFLRVLLQSGNSPVAARVGLSGGKRATTAKRKTPIFSPVIGRHRVRHVLPCTASTLSGIGVWRTEAVAGPRRARRIIIIIIIIIRAPFFSVDSVGKAWRMALDATCIRCRLIQLDSR